MKHHKVAALLLCGMILFTACGTTSSGAVGQGGLAAEKPESGLGALDNDRSGQGSGSAASQVEGSPNQEVFEGIPDIGDADYEGTINAREKGVLYTQKLETEKYEGYDMGFVNLDAPEDPIYYTGETKVYIHDYNRNTEEAKTYTATIEDIPVGASIWVFGSEQEGSWQAETIIALRVSV